MIDRTRHRRARVVLTGVYLLFLGGACVVALIALPGAAAGDHESLKLVAQTLVFVGLFTAIFVAQPWIVMIAAAAAVAGGALSLWLVVTIASMSITEVVLLAGYAAIGLATPVMLWLSRGSVAGGARGRF